MNIGSIANQLYNAINNQVNNTGSTDGAQLSQSSSDAMLKNGMSLLNDMNVGDIISGEIIKTDGNNILLSLGDNATLQATLNQGVNAAEGQLMTFMLKGNDGSKISLSPLYENLNSNPTVNAALSAAGLPETDKLQYMVRSMMEEGLPIDKQSLFNMNKAMNLNPNVDPLDLARMQRLNIPLTGDMVTQFESYKNFEHELTNAFSDISGSVGESLSMIMQNEGASESIGFFNDLMKILLPENEEAQAKSAVSDENPDGSAAIKGEVLKDVKALESDTEVLSKVSGDTEKTPVLSDKQLNSLAETLKQGGVSESFVKEIKSGGISQEELLKKLLNELERTDFEDKGGDKAKAMLLNKLTDNEGFRELLKDSLNKQWLLSPEEVAEDGKVTKLYEKLSEQVKQLTESLASQGRQETPVFQAANNVNQNLDFMNQINQAFNYVQIPLKMANGEETGELYVYTNKKSLAERDGDISALLHLDMEYLGPLDVHVTLNQANSVRTQFFLKDDSALDLIAQNIDILNQRLADRGYNMSAEFVNRDEKKSLIDNILENEGNVPVFSEFSFDARA